MKNWLRIFMNNEQEEELDYKQIVLSIIIFIVAIIFLTLAFHSENEEVQNTNTLSKAITDKLNKETRHNRVANILTSENRKKSPLINQNNKKNSDNVTLNFTITADKDMKYEIYYTTKAKEDFTEENMIIHQSKEGTQSYSIPLPVRQISRFSLKFENNVGKITIKDLSLSGSQQADLNNFNLYEFFQVDDLHINDDNSVSFTSGSDTPSIAYYPSLLPTEVIDEKTKEEIKNKEE